MINKILHQQYKRTKSIMKKFQSECLVCHEILQLFNPGPCREVLIDDDKWRNHGPTNRCHDHKAMCEYQLFQCRLSFDDGSRHVKFEKGRRDSVAAIRQWCLHPDGSTHHSRESTMLLLLGDQVNTPKDAASYSAILMDLDGLTPINSGIGRANARNRMAPAVRTL